MSLTEHASGTSRSSAEKASSSYPAHHVFIQARPRHTGPATVDRPPAPHLLSFLKSCTHNLLFKKSWGQEGPSSTSRLMQINLWKSRRAEGWFDVQTTA